MITTQLPDGTAVHHQHDQAGRLTYNKYTDGSWEAWEYDKAGRLTKAYNRDSVTEFVRNALGQVIKETQDGRTVEHKYDERSRLSNIVSALGGSITYGYDIKGTVNHISAGMSGKRKPWEANIAYDRFGRETSRIMSGCVENTMQYDNVGRPAHQRVQHNGRTLLDKSYLWGDNLRLLQTLDTINRRSVRYDYDTFGSLSGAVYGDGSCQWRNPDAMGNVYDSPDRTDRSYGRGGQLREDRKWRYYYDSHGNLVLKTMRRSGPSLETGMRDEFLAWQSGDYAYTWQGNGMLRSVTRPDGKTVTFKYDALGRRIEKVFDGRVYRYLWDGDVILHEWDYAEADRPNTIVTETGEVTLDRPEPVENLITWVYDSDSYVPTAKIVGDRHYSIISDYIGRPVQAYDDNGNIVWQADYDIYGNLRNLHGSRQFIPFRQLGQYEDEEIGLYYNRFRYYDPGSGTYISQDPIGLLGSNPTLYVHVKDVNTQVDSWGLLNEFGIAGYGTSPHIKDGLSAHELLQNAWLRNNGVITSRASGIAKNNPAMALQEKMMHKIISKLQAQYGLHNPNVLKKQTALQNINRNTALTRRGIYEDLVKNRGWEPYNAKQFATEKAMKLREEAIEFAKQNGLIKYN